MVLIRAVCILDSVVQCASLKHFHSTPTNYYSGGGAQEQNQVWAENRDSRKQDASCNVS